MASQGRGRLSGWRPEGVSVKLTSDFACVFYVVS